MRTVKFGKTLVGVKVSPLTPFLYKREFKSDLLGDIMGMQKLVDNPENIDIILLLQITYAMAKTVEYGKDFPDFEGWLASLDAIDLGDNEFILGIMEEAMEGLFRSGAKSFQKQAAESSRKI